MTFLTLTASSDDPPKKTLIALNRVFYFIESEGYTKVVMQDNEFDTVKESVDEIVSMLKTSQPNMFITYIGI